MLVNTDMLIDLTGRTRRTVLKKCIDIQKIKGAKGREILMESKDALPAIIYDRKLTDKTLESERTRLASAQAEKTELEVEVIKGNLIPADKVEEVVNGMISSFRAKMLSLPTKLAPAIVMMADVSEAESTMRDGIDEALTELSEYDAEQYVSKDDKQGNKAGGATAKANSKPVGGSKKKVIQGSKRRARAVEH